MSLPNEKFVLANDIPRSSKTTINISGFHVYLYGVNELTPVQAKDCTVVFHIHGRTRTYKDAEEVAHQLLHKTRERQGIKKGLVVASFDNRNHGERAIDTISINDWKGGNQTHGQDMLSTMDGIVVDVQTVMTFLGSYVVGIFVPTQFIVTGMSLGGHVSWDVLARDPRVNAAVIVVGCPNLTHMLLERLRNYISASHPHCDGMGGDLQRVSPKEWSKPIERLYVARDEKVAEIKGKKILILNGAIDLLVPSKFTRTWIDDYGLNNDVTFVEEEDTGHALTVQMMERIVDWIPQFLV